MAGAQPTNRRLRGILLKGLLLAAGTAGGIILGATAASADEGPLGGVTQDATGTVQSATDDAGSTLQDATGSQPASAVDRSTPTADETVQTTTSTASRQDVPADRAGSGPGAADPVTTAGFTAIGSTADEQSGDAGSAVQQTSQTATTTPEVTRQATGRAGTAAQATDDPSHVAEPGSDTVADAATRTAPDAGASAPGTLTSDETPRGPRVADSGTSHLSSTTDRLAGAGPAATGRSDRVSADLGSVATSSDLVGNLDGTTATLTGSVTDAGTAATERLTSGLAAPLADTTIAVATEVLPPVGNTTGPLVGGLTDAALPPVIGTTRTLASDLAGDLLVPVTGATTVLTETLPTDALSPANSLLIPVLHSVTAVAGILHTTLLAPALDAPTSLTTAVVASLTGTVTSVATDVLASATGVVTTSVVSGVADLCASVASGGGGPLTAGVAPAGSAMSHISEPQGSLSHLAEFKSGGHGALAATPGTISSILLRALAGSLLVSLAASLLSVLSVSTAFPTASPAGGTLAGGNAGLPAPVPSPFSPFSPWGVPAPGTGWGLTGAGQGSSGSSIFLLLLAVAASSLLLRNGGRGQLAAGTAAVLSGRAALFQDRPG